MQNKWLSRKMSGAALLLSSVLLLQQCGESNPEKQQAKQNIRQAVDGFYTWFKNNRSALTLVFNAQKPDSFLNRLKASGYTHAKLQTRLREDIKQCYRQKKSAQESALKKSCFPASEIVCADQTHRIVVQAVELKGQAAKVAVQNFGLEMQVNLNKSGKRWLITNILCPNNQ